ncbi:MAG: stage II sporulation protein M [Gemmatimonadales bacterium]
MPAPPSLRPRRATRPETAQDHRQRLEVETPENVVLDYELGGFGSRLLAALIDAAIVVVSLVTLFLLAAWLGGTGNWTGVIGSILSFVAVWGYYALFEGFYRGQTPGKKSLGLRVLRDSGQPIGFAEAALRNLVRVADFLPPPFLLGLGMIAFHPRAKRLGDLVAGTVVVRDRPQEGGLARPTPAPPGTEPAARIGAEGPRLSDEEFRVLGAFLERAAGFEKAVRERFAGRLIERFADRIPAGAGGSEALLDLYTEETARRSRPGGGGPGHGPADRFVRQKEGRWAEFQTLAEAAAAGGLDRFPPDRLVDFTTRYREVAADYARARTYGVAPGTIRALERAVAAGHNALYREKSASWQRLWRFLTTDCPAAVVEARLAVGLAFLTFAVPALMGFALLRERPDVAPQVLPATMLDRADAGARRQAEGKGYFEADPGDRPLVATSIILNNVRVAFACFASGVFAGVGSLVLLAVNGLSIGAASGHFANKGLFGYLWTFVIGHGFLELFAIWVAGAAGFQLGFAILNPGRFRRRDALARAGQRAIRMVGTATLLLIIAGLVEGLVSASGLGLLPKASISVGSALFLVAYLALGARNARAA